MNIVNSERIPKQNVLHSLALIVSLCSFVYELIYSELLTVMYGGTVTQYGLTYGLFFTSLGVGSYIAHHFDNEQHENFFRTELYLAIAGPAGFFLIIWLNTASIADTIPLIITQVLARLPVVVIGILSGFELPLLLAMVESEDKHTSGKVITKFKEHGNNVLYVIAAMFFHVDKDTDEYDTYATVLGMDYLGGLVGAIAFVFFLYPEMGLIASIFVIALLNSVAAITFSLRFSDKRWGLFNTETRIIRTHEAKSVFMLGILITSLYGTAVVNAGVINSEVNEYYTERLIEEEYTNNRMDINVNEQYRTKYQEVTLYDRTWTGGGGNYIFNGSREQCMRLDNALQLCESWAESYHHGLVDVPMNTFESPSDKDVLLVGGGDWIAANYLRDYGVDVDQVDLDAEFMRNMKSNEFVSQYHDDAYEYENLSVHQMDIYRYLQETNKQYDVILLDIPGAKSDKTTHLYSTEFYQLIRSHLREDGIVVKWAYSKYAYGEHEKITQNTLIDAGFTKQVEYYAYNDFDQTPNEERGERFILLTDNANPDPIELNTQNKYITQQEDKYQSLQWRPLFEYNGHGVNSVFKQEEGVIINTRLKAQRIQQQETNNAQ